MSTVTVGKNYNAYNSASHADYYYHPATPGVHKKQFGDENGQHQKFLGGSFSRNFSNIWNGVSGNVYGLAPEPWRADDQRNSNAIRKNFKKKSSSFTKDNKSGLFRKKSSNNVGDVTVVEERSYEPEINSEQPIGAPPGINWIMPKAVLIPGVYQMGPPGSKTPVAAPPGAFAIHTSGVNVDVTKTASHEVGEEGAGAFLRKYSSGVQGSQAIKQGGLGNAWCPSDSHYMGGGF